MTWHGAARTLTAIGLFGAAVCAPTSIVLARPKEPPVVEAPPPPLPPAGPVALPVRSLADAAAFQAYLERVGGASAAFTSAAAVGQTLRDASAFSTRALVRDAVAYGAIAALQDQQFVAELRAAGTSPENRRLMAGYLMNDPGYALLFRGSNRAAGLARAALESGGLRLYGAGKAVRQASYDMQHQAWSKLEVEGRPARLAAVEAEGRGSLPEAADHVEALQRAESGAAPLPISAGSLAPPYTPLVAKAIQLAAIAALGEASDELYDRLAGLAADDYSETCLHIAKLNLYQCLAVAKPNYEDAFCAGQHAMMDTGACLVRNAGGLTPFELGPPPPNPAFKRVVLTPPAHATRRAKKK
jgi:hypothetical protein